MKIISDGSSDEDIWEYNPVKKRKAEKATLRARSSDVPTTSSQRVMKRKKKVSGEKTHEKSKDVQRKTDNEDLIKRTRRGGSATAVKTSTLAPDSTSSNGPVNLQGNVSCEHTSAEKKQSPCQEATQCANASANKDAVTPRQSRKGARHKTPTPRKERKVHDGNCPFCQMPFSALTIESPRWHTMECMDLPIIAIQECPAGLACDNTIASHFRKFRHTLLAEKRAGCALNGDPTESIEAKERKCPKQLQFDPDHMSMDKTTFNMKKISETPNLFDEESGIEPFPSSARQEDTFTSVLEKSRSALASVIEKSKAAIYSVIEKSKSSVTCSTETTANKSEPVHVLPQHSNDVKSEIISEKDKYTFSQNTCSYSIDSTSIKHDTQTLIPKSESIVKPDDDSVQSTLEQTETLCARIKVEPTNEPIGTITWSLKEPQSASENTVNHKSDFTDKDLHDLLCDSDLEDETAIKSEPPYIETGNTVEIHNEPWLKTEKDVPPGLDNFHDKKVSVKQRPSPRKHQGLVKSPLRTSPRLAHSSAKQLSISSFFGGKAPAAKRTTAAQPSLTGTKKKATSQSLSSSRSSASTAENSQSSTASSAPPSESNTAYNKRPCPFYKKIPGTSFTVDAFRYGNIRGCNAYFLSHFHYDHYGGLAKGFSNPLYCSKITANLVKKKIRVADKYIISVPMDTPTRILGVEVTFLEANHCPGAVLILFKLPNGRCILHTGDFRADVSMQMNPALIGVRIDELYLDTTYCDPQYAFPPQRDAINLAVTIATDFLYLNPNTLVVVGSYTIGKERIFLAIAEALGCNICVTREKKNVLDCLEDPTIDKRLTLKAHDAKVHVLPMKDLRYPALAQYLEKLKPRFDKILGFEPTGWTHNGKKCPALEDIKPKIKSDNIVLYGIPYSEHSSYTELKSFVQFTRPGKILPTVNNGNPASRKKMEGLFVSWLKETSECGSPAKKLRQSAINTWFGK